METRLFKRLTALGALLFWYGCVSTQLVGEISPYTAPPRGGYSFQIPVEVLLTPTTGVVAGGGVVSGSDFALPMGAFDGDIELAFEIVGTMTTSSLEFRIVDALGATKASITPPASASPTRYRASMTTVPDAIYRLSVVGNGTYQLNAARVLISQKHATKTATYYPLIASNAAITAGNPVLTVNANTSYPGFPSSNVWTYRPSNYEGLSSDNPIIFESVFRSSSGLVDVTVGLQGADSASVPAELTGDSTLALRKTSITDLSVLNGETRGFGPNYKADAPAVDVHIHRAGLWVFYSAFKKGELYARLNTFTNTGTATYYAGNRYLFEASAWSSGATFYYEHTGFSAGSNNYYLRYDELDSGDTGAAVVGTQIVGSIRSVNSSTWTSRRSTKITSLPDQARIFVECAAGAGHSVRSHFLIIRYE